MRKVLFAFLFCLLFTGFSFATSITVDSFSFDDWTYGGSSATIRIYSNKTFVTSTGTTIVAGTASGFYKTISCTVSTGTVSCVSTTLDSTTDSSIVTAKYIADIYDGNGRVRGRWMEGFSVPTSLGTTVTWNQLRTYNAAPATGLPVTYYTADQVNALVATGTANLKTINGNTVTGIGDIAVQPTLVSGTNLKTINSTSLLGSGDIAISASSASLSATYSNSLATAISSIGATRTTLLVDADTTCSTALTIPATLKIKREAKAKIIKSGSCTIAFQGDPGFDKNSPDPVFSGFSAGDITFTGTVYPSTLSSNLWDDASLSTKLANAIGALSGKTSVVVAYPGALSAKFVLTSGLSIHFTKGTYTSTVSNAVTSMIEMQDNTRIYGDGQFQTFLTESASNLQFIRASGVSGTGTGLNYDGYNTNISVENIGFLGNPSTAVDSATSAVFLGNVTNAVVRNCYFYQTHGFAAYVGSFGTAGYTANNVWLTDNLVVGLQTQNMGAITGRNIHISRNTFILTQPSTAPALTVIDVEPNVDKDLIEDIFITDNIIDTRLATQTTFGIVVQAGGAAYIKNAVINNNLIIGADTTHHPFKDVDVSIANDTIALWGHGLQTGQPFEFATDGSLPTGLATSTLYYAIAVDANTLKAATSQANALAGTAVNITGAGSNWHYIFPIRYLASAIWAHKIDHGSVQNNTVKGGNQYGISVDNASELTVRNNKITMFGGGGVDAIHVSATHDSEFIGNIVNTVPDDHNSQANGLMEIEATSNVTTTAGSPNITIGDTIGRPHWSKQTVTINGSDYTVWQVPFYNQLILAANVPTTLGPKTFVDANVNTGTDQVTIAAHGFETGAAVYASSTGVLPTGTGFGLGVFYIIKVDVNTIKFALSYANALAGTAIDLLTAAGGGTHTLTPQLVTKFSNNSYKDNKLGSITLAPRSSSQIYSSFTDLRKSGTVTIDPASIGATTVATQTFTLTGAAVGDSLVLNPPATGLTAGLLVMQTWVSAADTISVTFYNTTGSPIDQASGTWNYTIFR